MKSAIAAILALSAAMYLPTQADAHTDVSVVVGIAPPAPRVEVVPAPRHGAIWVPGYWVWNGRHHVWLGGHWEHVRAGYRYEYPEWRRDRDGWRLYQGGWVPLQVEVPVVAQPAPVIVQEEMLPPPPQPVYETVPAPRPGFLWATGYWEWRGRHYDWVPGVWIEERPGHSYINTGWVQRDGRWVIERGHWVEGGHHDRDHDGVPDRYDRHPNDPRRN